jgi:hypothetical protein
VRAQKVYENIDFERGKDPKDALRVGAKYKWDTTREGLAWKIMVDVNDDDHFRDAIIRADMAAENAGYKDVDEYWEAVYGDGVVADSYYQRPEVEKWLEEVEEILDEKLKKYPWKAGKEAVVKGVFYDGAFRGVAYGSAINVIENALDPQYFINESTGFERGNDAKDSIGVGIKDKIINLDKIVMYVGEIGHPVTVSEEDTKRILKDMENGEWTYLKDPSDPTTPYCSEYMSFVSADETQSYDRGKTWYGKKRDPDVYPAEYRYLDGELEGKYIKYNGKVYKIPYIESQRDY